MTSLDEHRRALADAVTSTGRVTCLPYPEDNLAAPIAYVGAIITNFTTGMFGVGTFCQPGTAAAVITVTAQRNDLPTATRFLEDLIDPIVAAINSLDGNYQVITAGPDPDRVGDKTLPAHDITVQFPA